MLILFFLLVLSHPLRGGDIDSTGTSIPPTENVFEPGAPHQPPRAALFEPGPEDLERINRAEEALQKDAEELKRKTQKRIERHESGDAPHPDDDWGFCTVQ